MNDEDRSYIQDVVEGVSRSMFGIDDVVRLVLVALCGGGHVLLEGNPGQGKTALVKAVCETLGFGNNGSPEDGNDQRWGRIQFTPDLMPADITGTYMPSEEDVNRLTFMEGPIFHWLLLADEINRATPKTQSAMLEAMAESQVTVFGTTYPITPETLISHGGSTRLVRPPFMVLATQNPIDQEGTYDLPEAQADRFMFKVRMPFPTGDTLERIMGKDAGALAATDDKNEGCAGPVATEHQALHHFDRIRRGVLQVIPSQTVQDHIVNIILASNGDFHGLRDVPKYALERLKEMVNQYVAFGCGPRAATALMLGAKGWASLFLPDNGTHVNVALARVAVPVLRHRLLLDMDWESRYDREVDGKAVCREDLRDRLLTEFILNTAPDRTSYRELLREQLSMGSC